MSDSGNDKDVIVSDNAGISICINGHWTIPEISCRSSCQPIVHFENEGYSITGRGFVHGSTRDVSCAAGYLPSVAVGGETGVSLPQQVTCADGRWSEPSFRCVPTCAHKPAFDEKVFDIKFLSSDRMTARLTCREGYMHVPLLEADQQQSKGLFAWLTGNEESDPASDVIRCSKGRWPERSRLHCKRMCSDPHASLQALPETQRDRITPFFGGDWTPWADQEASESQAGSFLQKAAAPVNRTSTDSALPTALSKRARAVNGRFLYPDGSRVRLRCSRGFLPVSGKEEDMVCQDGAWTVPALQCEKGCDPYVSADPRLVLTSAQQRSELAPPRSEVELTCAPGFAPVVYRSAGERGVYDPITGKDWAALPNRDVFGVRCSDGVWTAPRAVCVAACPVQVPRSSLQGKPSVQAPDEVLLTPREVDFWPGRGLVAAGGSATPSCSDDSSLMVSNIRGLSLASKSISEVVNVDEISQAISLLPSTPLLAMEQLLVSGMGLDAACVDGSWTHPALRCVRNCPAFNLPTDQPGLEVEHSFGGDRAGAYRILSCGEGFAPPHPLSPSTRERVNCVEGAWEQPTLSCTPACSPLKDVLPAGYMIVSGSQDRRQPGEDVGKSVRKAAGVSHGARERVSCDVGANWFPTDHSALNVAVFKCQNGVWMSKQHLHCMQACTAHPSVAPSQRVLVQTPSSDPKDKRNAGETLSSILSPITSLLQQQTSPAAQDSRLALFGAAALVRCAAATSSVSLVPREVTEALYDPRVDEVSKQEYGRKHSSNTVVEKLGGALSDGSELPDLSDVAPHPMEEAMWRPWHEVLQATDGSGRNDTSAVAGWASSVRGAEQVICFDGKWSSSTLTCKRDCEPFPFISEAYLVDRMGRARLEPVPHGSGVKVRCAEDSTAALPFGPDGSLGLEETLTCEDGKWQVRSMRCFSTCKPFREVLQNAESARKFEIRWSEKQDGVEDNSRYSQWLSGSLLFSRSGMSLDGRSNLLEAAPRNHGARFEVACARPYAPRGVGASREVQGLDEVTCVDGVWSPLRLECRAACAPLDSKGLAANFGLVASHLLNVEGQKLRAINSETMDSISRQDTLSSLQNPDQRLPHKPGFVNPHFSEVGASLEGMPGGQSMAAQSWAVEDGATQLLFCDPEIHVRASHLPGYSPSPRVLPRPDGLPGDATTHGAVLVPNDFGIHTSLVGVPVAPAARVDGSTGQLEDDRLVCDDGVWTKPVARCEPRCQIPKLPAGYGLDSLPSPDQEHSVYRMRLVSDATGWSVTGSVAEESRLVEELSALEEILAQLPAPSSGDVLADMLDAEVDVPLALVEKMRRISQKHERLAQVSAASARSAAFPSAFLEGRARRSVAERQAEETSWLDSLLLEDPYGDAARAQSGLVSRDVHTDVDVDSLSRSEILGERVAVAQLHEEGGLVANHQDVAPSLVAARSEVITAIARTREAIRDVQTLRSLFSVPSHARPVVEVSCREGFSAHPEEHFAARSQLLFCANGQWSAFTLQCRRTCSAPPPELFNQFENLVVSTPDGETPQAQGVYAHGYQFKLSCAEGFGPVGARPELRVGHGLDQNGSLTCADGRWSLKAVRCERQCRPLKASTTLRVDDHGSSSTNPGALRTLSCQPGYFPVSWEQGHANEVVRCANGRWGPTPRLRCVPGCTAFAPPAAEGYVVRRSVGGNAVDVTAEDSAEAVPHGAVREVSCAAGYRPIRGFPGEVVSCRGGLWAQTVLRCERALSVEWTRDYRLIWTSADRVRDSRDDPAFQNVTSLETGGGTRASIKPAENIATHVSIWRPVASRGHLPVSDVVVKGLDAPSFPAPLVAGGRRPTSVASAFDSQAEAVQSIWGLHALKRFAPGQPGVPCVGTVFAAPERKPTSMESFISLVQGIVDPSKQEGKASVQTHFSAEQAAAYATTCLPSQCVANSAGGVFWQGTPVQSIFSSSRDLGSMLTHDEDEILVAHLQAQQANLEHLLSGDDTHAKLALSFSSAPAAPYIAQVAMGDVLGAGWGNGKPLDSMAGLMQIPAFGKCRLECPTRLDDSSGWGSVDRSCASPDES